MYEKCVCSNMVYLSEPGGLHFGVFEKRGFWVHFVAHNKMKNKGKLLMYTHIVLSQLKICYANFQ